MFVQPGPACAGWSVRREWVPSSCCAGDYMSWQPLWLLKHGPDACPTNFHADPASNTGERKPAAGAASSGAVMTHMQQVVAIGNANYYPVNQPPCMSSDWLGLRGVRVGNASAHREKVFTTLSGAIVLEQRWAVTNDERSNVERSGPYLSYSGR